jgi:NifU-like protein involved in Fe-S cluster formation
VIPNKETEKITVSLTLKDGVITEANFQGNPVEQGSIFNQKKFSEGYTALVVGKNIDDVALTVVNGASLTPIGFMEALKVIKTKATQA